MPMIATTWANASAGGGDFLSAVSTKAAEMEFAKTIEPEPD